VSCCYSSSHEDGTTDTAVVELTNATAARVDRVLAAGGG
jgi:hypothetical protein